MEWYELSKNDLIISWHIKNIIKEYIALHFWDDDENYFLSKKIVDNEELYSKNIKLTPNYIKDYLGRDISYYYTYNFIVINYSTFLRDKVNIFKKENLIIIFNNENEFIHFLSNLNNISIKKSIFFNNFKFVLDEKEFNNILIFYLKKSSKKTYKDVIKKLIKYNCDAKSLINDDILISLKNLRIKEI